MKDKTFPESDPTGFHTLQVISKSGHFNKWMYAAIKDFLKGEVLEIGSGIGNISQLVIQDGYSITLSDYNEQYCCYLKEKFSNNNNVKNILSIDLVHTNFENEYFSYKGNFDCIFLLNVIEHIKNDMVAIKNCQYLLKDGGHIIVLAPAYSWLYCTFDKQLGHYRRYSLKSCKQLLSNGFRIHSAFHFNFIGIIGWFVFGKIFNKKMLGKEMSAFDKIVPLCKIVDKMVLSKMGLSIIIKGIKI